VTRWYRDPFAISAGALAAVAFAGSFDHTRATVLEHGQTGWIATATALMPEASVLLSVLRIRRGGTTPQLRWAWLVLVASAGFTILANLAQAEPSVWGYVVAGWPAWAAIGAAGFIEMRPEEEEPSPVKKSSSTPRRTSAPTVTTTPSGSLPGVAQSTSLALVADAGTKVEQAKARALAMAETLERLPSQSELAAEGVSLSTAKRALAEMRKEAA
jgi:hypothetical protein